VDVFDAEETKEGKKAAARPGDCLEWKDCLEVCSTDVTMLLED